MSLRKILGVLLICLPLQAHADFGCHFVLGQRLSSALDSTDKKISFRFTCREDMNLIALSFYCEDAKNPPGYLASLHEDKGGFPVEDALVSAGVTPKGKSWMTVPVSDTPLLAGKVYHLVLEQDTRRGGSHPVGVIGPNNFASFSYGEVLNPFDPRAESPDPKLNTLIFEKGKWRVLDRQPLYAIHGSGSKAQGVPYDEAGELAVHGNGTPADRSDDVLWGEALHPHAAFPAKGFAVRLRRQGNPTAPLDYRVYTIDFMHHKTSLAYSGLAVPSDRAKTYFQWVTIGLRKEDHPQPFPPECRYITFQTDSGHAISEAPGCADCYILSEAGNSGGLASAAELTFDGGAHLSREAYSLDGGATWLDKFERDVNIAILGNPGGNIESTLPGPIPTPEPLFNGWTP